MVMPGDNVQMGVELITPVAIEEGLRFAIREGGRTVGAGVVTKSSSSAAYEESSEWHRQRIRIRLKAYDHKCSTSRRARSSRRRSDRAQRGRSDAAADPDREVHA